MFRYARSYSLSFLVVLGLWFGNQAAVQATTFYVPSQYASIQAALNVSGNGDVIVIADGTYSGSGNVDLDFLGSNVTVQSASGNPSQTVIDCKGSSSAYHRGFYFHNGETRAVVQGITIKNGYIDYGGAVDVQSSSAVTLTNCIFTKNISTSNGSGGGIYNDGRVTLNSCTLSQNSAQNGNGGGLDNTGIATLTNCLISQNMTSYNGGGVGNRNQVTLTNCTFTQNSATGNGGGLMNYSQATLINCKFMGNTATNGGGCYTDSYNFTMTNSILIQNNADSDGGGLYNDYDAIVTNCTVTQNAASSTGGGYYNNWTITLTK